MARRFLTCTVEFVEKYIGIPAADRREIRRDIPALPFCHITLTVQKYSFLPKVDKPVTLGDHLRNRRVALGFLHQKDVANFLKISKATVYNWENNRSSPSLYQIPKVIKFLGYYPNHTINESLGERIFRARRALGMTQKELARRLGVDPGTLGYWEREEKKPWKEVKEKLKRFLDSLGSGWIGTKNKTG